MRHPTVSVVIPLYNRQDYILKSLESIQDQILKPLEVIIVDDGSTDQGPRLVREYAQFSPLSIVLVPNHRPKGVSGARNTGVKLARGEYIAFLDSDDLWGPMHLQRLYEGINQTYADLVASDFEFFGVEEFCDLNVRFFNKLKHKMLLNGFTMVGERRFLSNYRLFQTALLVGFSLRIQATLVHRDVFHKNGVWFDENISFLEDHQFYLECAYNRISMAYIDEKSVMIRKFQSDSRYDQVESHRYRMKKMMREFDSRVMSLEERDAFERAVHDMGFLWIKGLIGVDWGGKKPPERSVLQRTTDSIRFLRQFPTNRGLREAVKNIIGVAPARFLVSLVKNNRQDDYSTGSPKEYVLSREA